MKTTDVRRSLVTAGLVAALLAMWPAPAFPQGKRGGVITFALYQEPETLNPYIATQTASSEVEVFVVEGFLGRSPEGEYTPRLATEVPSRQNGGVSADGRTITYHLKPGLKWSDGQPVTCEDVRFTWQAIVHPQSGAVSTTGYREIDGVDCPSPATAVIRYKTFYAPFLSRFTAIMPKHATGDPAEMPRWAYNRKLVGTGPFTMLEWVSGDHITLIPNRYYRQAGRPRLDGVIVRITPSREVGKQLIKTGEVAARAAVPQIRSWFPNLKTVESRALENTPETSVISGRWVPPLYGSLSMTTSPGPGLRASIAAATDNGIDPRWTGM